MSSLETQRGFALNAGDVVGWDIGGAHVKACFARGGRVHDVAQWPCPLWQGLAALDAVLAAAALRWPGLATAQHAVTMTGEMVDLFAHREEGVLRIAAQLAQHVPAGRMRFFAGDGGGDDDGGGMGASGGKGRSAAHGDAATAARPASRSGWCSAAELPAQWPRVASANWLATAQHVATALADAPHGGVLVDIGSTTTDLVAFRAGRVLTRARSDAERLASGELVYHGVVRTPLCALARRIAFRGVQRNVMNEFFATTADVYRLTGELRPAHDQQPTADNAGKGDAATQQRLARMVGLDARDASAADWLAFAQAWRAEQVAEWRGQLRRVMALHGLPVKTLLVSAGCGDFIVPALRDAETGFDTPLDPERGAGRHGPRYADLVPGSEPDPSADPDDLAERIQLCAPSVAVALLFTEDEPLETTRCGS